MPVQLSSGHTPQALTLDAKTRMLLAVRPLIARLPVPVGNLLADRLGDLVYTFARQSRLNAISNMRHVLGKGTPRNILKKKVKGIFRNVIRSYYELCRAYDMPEAEIDRLVVFDAAGWQRVMELHNQKRGIVLATGHFGSFNMMGHLLTRHGLPFTSPVARIKPSWLSDFVTTIRATSGVNLLILDEDESSTSNLAVLKECLRILRSGGVVGVVADRNSEQNGLPISFFGEEIIAAVGAAKMAIRTNSVIVPTICYHLPDGRYGIIFEEPIEPGESVSDHDIQVILSRLFSRFEYYIGRNPEQWLLLQPVWRN